MRKFSFLFLLLIGFLGSAQYADQDNRFNQSTDQSANQTTANGGTASADGDGDGGSPGNPGEAPIDDYIPLLMIAGLGLIVYTGLKKKNSLN